MEERRARARGYLLAAACAACAGSAAVVGKLGVEEAPSHVFSFWLFVFATAFSGVGLVVAERGRVRLPGPPIGRMVLGHAAISFVAVWSLWAGMARINPAVGSFVGRAETIVAIGAGIVFLSERFRRREGLGTAIAIAGVAIMGLASLLEAEDSGTALGFLLVLVGASGFGSAELISKVAVRHTSPTTFVFLRNATLLLMFGAFTALSGNLALPSRTVLLSAGGVALLAPVLARTLFMTSLRTLELSKAAVVNQLQPFFAAVLTLIVLDDLPKPLEWVGGVVLVLGCAVLVTAAGARDET